MPQEPILPGRSFRLRARVVAGLFCAVCFAGLAARLAWLQLAGADGYAQRALGQQLRDTAVPAGRGLILSADGVVLATNASCWTIRACPREMPEARLELAAQGDLDARNKLIEHNLRLVVFLARKFESSGVGTEDLISIGTIGLIKAVSTYRSDKNVKLAT